MKAGFSAFLRRLSALASILILVGSGAPFPPGLQAAEKGRPAAEAEQIGKISFLVLGDWGRQGERLQREVAGQMGVYAASRGADGLRPDRRRVARAASRGSGPGRAQETANRTGQPAVE